MSFGNRALRRAYLRTNRIIKVKSIQLRKCLDHYGNFNKYVLYHRHKVIIMNNHNNRIIDSVIIS